MRILAAKPCSHAIIWNIGVNTPESFCFWMKFWKVGKVCIGRQRKNRHCGRSGTKLGRRCFP